MATEKKEVFKCKQCGAVVAILQGGSGDLACCDNRMMEVTPDKAKKLIFDLQRPGTP